MNLPIPTIGDFSVLDFELWAFVLLRISTMVFLLPVIGAVQVPSQVKIGLTFFLSIIIFPVLPDIVVQLPDTVPGFILLALREIFVGLTIGFSSTLIFIGLSIAGSLIDHNTGLAMIQSINPLTEENESVAGQLLFLCFSLVMLVSGMHLFFVQVVAESFTIIPLLEVNLDYAKVASVMLKLTSQCFVYGIKLSLPLVVPLLLTTAGLAVIARIMPQINVWLVGMPLKIGVGLITLAAVMPLLWTVFKKQVYEVEFYQVALLKIFGG